MSNLPCENGGGSLNNPNGTPTQTGTNNSNFKPYTPPNIPLGTWEISGINPDICAQNEQNLQGSYVAETLNISGAPLNVYLLKGIHQQGEGKITSQGKIISSLSFPGYPVSNINNFGVWRSLTSGNTISSSTTYVGIDFGIKMMVNQSMSEYEPHKTHWTNVGGIELIQSNDPNKFAKQVKVEIADGTCQINGSSFIGTGNGLLSNISTDVNSAPGIVTIRAITSLSFNCYMTFPDMSIKGLGTATVGIPFRSTNINFTINAGSTNFVSGDEFSINVDYAWNRVGIFNLVQSSNVQVINLSTVYKCKALKISPTLFTGNSNWEISTFDVLDSPPTDINNIQDLFFNENRDRDYSVEPIMIKAQYTPANSVTDLSKFGLSILDQYTFTVSFAVMVKLLSRPIVVGDIIEVIPEMQWDQNLKPIRKFLEVTDTGWSAEGFGTAYNPTVFRFNAQIAMATQETRDLFGTLDTQKYMVPDAVIANDIPPPLNVWDLIATEETQKSAEDAVPETGTDDIREIGATIPHKVAPKRNVNGQPDSALLNMPQTPTVYTEAGLPPNGESYGEGYKLPDTSTVTDGEYFRLYYPEDTNIPPRLYRFSALKNRWIYLETDRRQKTSSAKPSLQKILQSNTNKPLDSK